MAEDDVTHEEIDAAWVPVDAVLSRFPNAQPTWAILDILRDAKRRAHDWLETIENGVGGPGRYG